jgi:signal peptidase II
MSLKKFLQDKKIFFVGITIALLSSILDILSKEIIAEILEKNSLREIKIIGFFNLVYVWNRGISFGMFSGFAHSQIVLSSLVLIITIVVMNLLYRAKNIYFSYSFGLIIGGGFGNLFDRIKNGAVFDFLDFFITINEKQYHWPAFNLADSLVFVGVFMLILEDCFKNRKAQSL